jgi:serine/threonine-protein kinase
MEYIPGSGLDELLRANKRFTPQRVARLIGQLCDVLQSAHDQRIIHRDLKPSNLMVMNPDSPDEQVKVMDFGLAKIIGPPTAAPKMSDTSGEFALGTPSYISPEQVRGEEIDHRADIYSVGVISYELLSGRLPFSGMSHMDMILAHATERPTSFADLGLRNWVPRPVERLVMDCLEKDPTDRPQSARELADRFEAALAYREDDPILIPTTTAARDEAESLTFHLDAWLPQRIALVKIRGFVHDSGGDVIDSAPGIIHVRIPPRPTRRSAESFAVFRHAPRDSSAIDVELRLEQLDPERENKLRVMVLFHPPDPSLLHEYRWRERCNQLFCDVRSYLMGKREA